MSMVDIKKISVLTPAIIFGSFIAGSVLSPFLSKFSEKYAESLFARKNIRIESCAPLKDARILIRKQTDKGDEIIADQKMEHINETTVFIQNLTDKTIKNATLTVYPLSQSSTNPPIWYTRMYASSIKGTSSYKVQKNKSTYQINIPIFNIDEFILIETKFGEPIGYIVELFSDEISKKDVIEPGCADGSYIKSAPPTFFYSYYGEPCERPQDTFEEVKCKYKIVAPFNITEDMKGKKILVEHKITY